MLLSKTYVALACTCLAEAAIISQFSSPGRLTGSSFGIPSQNATYDYIIVGGGQAGSVMAARLTEHSNATVAIVEAGNFYEISNGNWSQIPYFSQQYAGSEQGDYNPLVDFGLETTPQANGEVIHYAQGRNLGGSSGRNQMLYHRPTKGYYEAFADHVGDLSYTWDNMTTCLERSMTFHPPNMTERADASSITYDASAFLDTSNASNPLQVSYPAYSYELSSYAPQAFGNIGLQSQPGFSSGVLHGYGYWAFTIDPETGIRSSAESSFLAEAFNRDTLSVYLNSLVQNVIFNANKTAIGVNVTSSPAGTRTKFYTLSARKEILLSAGAYHSPQLLMLSGIGPEQTLRQHNIPIISALEGVGQNMWDTTNIGGPVYRINNTFTSFSDFQNNATITTQIDQQFANSGTGPLTNEGSDVAAWYKFPQNITSTFSNATQAHIASLPTDWPEVELILSTSSRSLEVADDNTKQGTISCLMIATASRGNMTIASSSILDRPIISPNWLLDPRDREVAIATYRAARTAWQGIPEGVRIGDEIFPGKNVTSDEDLEKAIVGNIAAIHHASASCAMGRVGERDTVVDSRGRVVGVQGLRVVDSSALPFTPPGHTQGTVYAHAEKMAQVVLNDM
ncbi:hypothetical protein PMZ80_000263 [Knufia obscura]|uniref:Glucose-methanol-choline oxidoreductase N-terminal domain-containing protein n=1 Tax=Knufia obscura TaxID=1635080 RepID=A0ABR0RZT8_9EURO|nr:hypothetical protein PMZ80_000263 [Knufia obscura]